MATKPRSKEMLLSMSDEEAKELTEAQKRMRKRYLKEAETEVMAQAKPMEPEMAKEIQSCMPQPVENHKIDPLTTMHSVNINAFGVSCEHEQQPNGSIKKLLTVKVNANKYKVYLNEQQEINHECFIALQGLIEAQRSQ